MAPKIWLRGFVVAAGLALGASWAGAAEIHTGEDFTKPLSRVDLRLKYRLAVGENHGSTVATARADVPMGFGGGWELVWRADVPYSWSDEPSADNPDAVTQHGLGDVLVQGLLIAPAGGKWAYGLGAQLIFPTAEKNQMGTGKLQLVPTVGVRYDLGGWARGAWCGALLRHAFDVASRDDDRPHVSQTSVQPVVHVMLPRLWFLTFAPETRYDWREERWFVPFDVTVGKMLSASVVAAVEYRSAVVDDLPQFSQEVEARIGFLF